MQDTQIGSALAFVTSDLQTVALKIHFFLVNSRFLKAVTSVIEVAQKPRQD